MGNVAKIVLSAAVIVLLSQPLLFAKPRGQKPGKCQGNREDCMKEGGGPIFGNPARMEKELGLSGDQVKKIAAINKDFRKKMLDYHGKLAPKDIQLKKILLEDTVDMDQVKTALKEISDLRMELQLLKIQHRLEIEKVLTPEQKAKMLNHRRGMMRDRGRGPQHGPEM